MSKRSWVLIILAAFFAVLLFFGPQISWRMRQAFLRPESEFTENKDAEIIVLKAELAKLESIKSQLPTKPPSYIRGIIFSRYPMNFKNEFLLNAGSVDGVAEKRAVVFDGVLVGRITKVFEDTSLAQTVLDYGFQTPVRIGPYAYEALFKGGLTPKITLIPLDAKIQKGDVFYSASPDFPYGFPIGEVKDISVSGDNLFKEATVNLSYDLGRVQTVLISKN